jgi:hypothetical protein
MFVGLVDDQGDNAGETFCPDTCAIELLPAFAPVALLAEAFKSLLERGCILEDRVFLPDGLSLSCLLPELSGFVLVVCVVVVEVREPVALGFLSLILSPSF